MRAYTLTSPDGPDGLTLRDLPDPTPGAHEVSLEVRAISLNPVDFKTGRGKALYGSLQTQENLILGWDVSGLVREVGADVTAFRPGDAVFGMVNFPGHGRAYATHVVAPAAHLAQKPEGISHAEAAAATLAALTAWQNLYELADVQAGQRVLVHAAGGGVGHFAVQLARERGAYVIGTSSGSKRDFVLELGADEHVDYEQQRFEDVLEPVDLVLDSLGPEHLLRSLQIVKPGGRLMTIAAGLSDTLQERAEWKTVALNHHLVKSNGEQMAAIAARLADGRLRAHVSQTYSFEQLPSALRELEGGKAQGKIVVEV
ncbi:NADP-dependent oxidoreductase [Neolewinella litorea]|uniref:NADP-dependent oxidoreductase n=1 Tax=Neolewinella litorea TaxID=2562452 RepID=A0A4V3XL74_9BACT|nr:NADP-dependent oxidoreductase [Neolewinella litorea]THH39743.1 NADP-dependent oxidoreductase [Neolewinella litorea]